MRLIHTTPSTLGTLRIEEFLGDAIPSYAILSHTWGEEEVTFQDMQSRQAEGMKGYEKIAGCCAYAKSKGFSYLWVDTCCIDKTSSAELSEAINSMYRWYQEADECYAYLSDVLSKDEAQFKESKWFTRGWTLQELIAPADVIFLNKDWGMLGTKIKMAATLSQWTGVRFGILTGSTDLDMISIAQRMSWASQRRTSRIEDEAYCLMGLFGINMPLIYGEGQRAFIRLQEEIMKVSDDLSVFIWKTADQSRGGLLAPSPHAFKDSADIIRGRNPALAANTPLTVSGKGVHLEAPFIAVGHDGLGLAVLDYTNSVKSSQAIGIFVRDMSLTWERFERVWCHRFELLDLGIFRPVQYPFVKMVIRHPRLGRQHEREPRRRRQGIMMDEVVKMFDQGGLSITRKSLKSASRSMDGETSSHLIKTIQKGSMFWLKVDLEDSKVNPDYQDIDGRTALSYAADYGHADLVWLLLMYPNVKPNYLDSRGWSPLDYAAQNGHREVVWLLLSRSDVQAALRDHGRYLPLYCAARNGHQEIVDMILLRAPMNTSLPDSHGRTPLSHAAEHGHAGVVESILIKDSRGLNIRDHQGLTPLCWATKNGHSEVMSLLLEQGADSEHDFPLSGEPNTTPLWLSVLNNDSYNVWLLLDHGVNTEVMDTEGRTPLVSAVQNHLYSIAQLLIKFGADIEALKKHDIETDEFFIWLQEQDQEDSDQVPNDYSAVANEKYDSHAVRIRVSGSVELLRLSSHIKIEVDD